MILQEENGADGSNETNDQELGTRPMIGSKTRLSEAGLSAALCDRVAGNDGRLVEEWRRWFFALPPSEEPDEWAEVNMFFDEQEVKGRCDFTGRNFLRRPIRDNNNPEMREQTLVFGRGCGKTLTQIIGISWKILFAGSRGLMVFPATNGEGGSGNFVSTRLIPDIEATPVLSALLPKGQQRFDVNKKHVTLNGAHFGFVGSNSAGQVVGNRLSDIRMDELEKFKMKLGNEAGTAKLIKGSTEGVKEFQVFNTSTPSIDSGLIWQSLAKSNFMLCFVPCPHCQRDAGPSLGKTEEERQARALANGFKGWFVYAWNEQFAMGLPAKFSYAVPLNGGAGMENLEIPMGFVRWPKSCKGRDGVWDLEGVKRGAFVECPHCKGAIRDAVVTPDGRFKAAPEIKIWMDANHFWMGTQPGEPRHLGYQLSSLYAPVMNEESTWGGRASKFLSAVAESPEAVNDFINSILGLAAVGQAHGKLKTELLSRPMAQPDWVCLLTADFHKNWPYIWFVARRWCAFKLLPPFGITNGKPDFVELLELPGNEGAKENCKRLVAACDPAWNVLAELMRFDSQTGQSPLVDFLLAQNICGEKLVAFFRETAAGNTMDFRRLILLEMARVSGASGEELKKFRAPRGGDSELVAAGSLELSGKAVWNELRDIESEFEVGKGLPMDRRCAAVDCGYAERFNREVLGECYDRAQHFKWYDPMSKNSPPLFHGLWRSGESSSPARHQFCQPCPADGWLALRGIPGMRPQGAGKMNHELGLNVEDPFYGSAEAGSSVVEVLKIPQGLFWLRLDHLRQKRTKNIHGISPDVSWFPKRFSAAGERMPESNFKQIDYEKQMNEQYYDEVKGLVVPKHGQRGSSSRLHPYHLNDCEVYQVALATHLEFFQRDAGPK